MKIFSRFAVLLLVPAAAVIIFVTRPLPGTPEVWVWEDQYKWPAWIRNQTAAWELALTKHGSSYVPLHSFLKSFQSTHGRTICTLDREGKTCFTPVVVQNWNLNPYGMTVFNNGQMGVLSPYGYWLVPPNFDRIELVRVRHGIAEIKALKKEKETLFQLKLNPPEEPQKEPAKDGSHFVYIEGEVTKMVLVDVNGQRLLPGEYIVYKHLRYNISLLKSTEEQALISGHRPLFWAKGAQIGDFVSEANISYGYGLIKVQVEGKTGLITCDGKYFIKPEFGALGHYREGLIPAAPSFDADQVGRETNSKNDAISLRMGFIDHTGAWVIPPEFIKVGRFSEGLAIALDPKTMLWGFIDYEGKWQISPRINCVRSFLGQDWSTASSVFRNGLCYIDGQMMDLKGDIIIPSSVGLTAWVERKGDPHYLGIYLGSNFRYGLIDKKGRMKTPAQYIEICPIPDPNLPNPNLHGRW